LPGRIAFLIAAAAILAAACGGDGGVPYAAAPVSTPPPAKLTFVAGFKPQANLPFVGAYVAQEKGFFREQNLEVEIKHAASPQNLQLLLSGDAQITTGNAASVLRRRADPGVDIVSIALIGQRSEQGFAVGANSGIQTVADWAGKTFGFKGTVPVEFLAITRANGVDPARIRQVSVGFDPRVLSEGAVDILPVFFSNEPNLLKMLGYDVRLFDPNNYGIAALGLTYIATGDYVRAQPDVIVRFLKAVLRGIYHADQNREEALAIVMKYAPDENREHQRFMLTVELERAITDLTRKNGIGWQTLEQWKGMHDSLLEFQGIAKALDVSLAYTDAFLKQVYRDGKLVWP
jgi:ABC-type nitrate/sulfonate/bicarbonate transport system substrate-binding protein